MARYTKQPTHIEREYSFEKEEEDEEEIADENENK